MSSRLKQEIVFNALLMAVWRRRPDGEVIVHSDQGVQYTSEQCQGFMKAHQLVSSMIRRGSCYDNAVAESFFALLKRERVNRRVYKTRLEARSDIFDYIERFYNQRKKRKMGIAHQTTLN